MEYLTTTDVVAMLRAAEDPDESVIATALDSFLPPDLDDDGRAAVLRVLRIVAVLVVLAERAHEAGLSGESWTDFLDGLDAGHERAEGDASSQRLWRRWITWARRTHRRRHDDPWT